MNKYVTYEQFGAKGDGVTDDFAAIYATHKYANEYGLPVMAKDDAEYYIHDPRIHGKVEEIPVRTDCLWGNARFTIDDRDISVLKGSETCEWYDKAIFKIVSDYDVERITDRATLDRVAEAGINKNSTRVDLKLGYPAMIIPYNSSHKVYRRRGYGGWQGSDMSEVILLDAEGNISEETPIMFDYDHIDCIKVYRLDIKPITLDGGIFTTRASRVNTLTWNEDGTYKNAGGYIHRGLNITRSFTTVKNLKHYITDEVSMRDQVDENGKVIHISACYQGFYLATNSNHILFENCVISGRRAYNYPTGGAGGTYGLSGGYVNKIVFKNCKQANFWVTVDENYDIHPANENDAGAMTSMSRYNVKGTSLMMHWGIGGTNYCKNMEYIDCLLSRFDAHCGLYNGKIINSTINGMEVVGNGTLALENSRWFAAGSNINAGANNSLIYLRDDYASTWDGEISVKNFEAYVHTEANTYIVCHSYNNWYYGYQAYYPNLTVEGLRIFDFNTRKPAENYEIRLTGSSVLREPAMNLPETANTCTCYPDVDEDGDGLVDGTNIPYDSVVDVRGVTDPSTKKNINPIIPPKYIKVINGDGAGTCRVAVPDTSEFNCGGFFGSTEFISKNATCVGTAPENSNETFRFASISELRPV